MPFAKEIQTTVFGLLVAFFLVAIAAGYWAVFGPDSILGREDNPRLVEATSAILRGRFYDRDLTLLAETTETESGVAERDYTQSAMNSVLGYYSLRYGVGGLESTYDTILSGQALPDDWSTFVNESLLHRPRVGTDVQLTVDLSIQQAIVEAMGDQAGAALVVSVPSGGLLSLVSLPTYDPNTLATDWETLVEAPDKPFFNRALQGQYQPGSTMQTLLLGAASLASLDTTRQFSGASDPVDLDDIALNCVLAPPEGPITLIQSYSYGCPQPFLTIAEQLGEDTVYSYLERIGDRQTTLLQAFATPTPTEDTTPTPSVTDEPEANFQEEVLGQGNMTVSPLTLSTMVAAILSNGSTRQPHTILATKPPQADDWQPYTVDRNPIPFFTEDTANALLNAMKSAFAVSPLADMPRPEGVEIGGQYAISHTGDGQVRWFVGFVRLPSQQSASIVIALEPDASIDALNHVVEQTIMATIDNLTEATPPQ
ncbi:MAG: hypothetical protein CL607_14150 [Anaerolineaceae bacterium]|nr:hypothetical protein [Anaerolineaceae bacterium]